MEGSCTTGRARSVTVAVSGLRGKFEATRATKSGAGGPANSDTAALLNRLYCNDTSLKFLYVNAALLGVLQASTSTAAAPAGPQLPRALRSHCGIRSLVVTPQAIHLLTQLYDCRADVAGLGRAHMWSQLLQSCYHLPLRVLCFSGLGLRETELALALELVAHLSGTECYGQPVMTAVPASREASAVQSMPAAATVTQLSASGSFAAINAAAPSAPPQQSRDGSLRTLDLSGNKLTSALASQLGDILAHPCCTLRRVDLQECGLGDEGACALLLHPEAVPAEGGAAPRLRSFGLVEELLLQWNGITGASDAAVGVLLTCGPPVRARLDGNHLSAEIYRWYREVQACRGLSSRGVSAKPVPRNRILLARRLVPAAVTCRGGSADGQRSVQSRSMVEELVRELDTLRAQAAQREAAVYTHTGQAKRLWLRQRRARRQNQSGSDDAGTETDLHTTFDPLRLLRLVAHIQKHHGMLEVKESQRTNSANLSRAQ